MLCCSVDGPLNVDFKWLCDVTTKDLCHLGWELCGVNCRRSFIVILFTYIYDTPKSNVAVYSPSPLHPRVSGL